MKQENALDSNSIKSKIAVVTDIDGTLNIFLREKRGDINRYDILLEDMEIEIKENGLMHMTGKKVDFYYNSSCFGEPLNYEELKEKDEFVLHEKYVYQPKFFIWNVGKLKYSKTWVEYKERQPYEVSTSNYRITGVK